MFRLGYFTAVALIGLALIYLLAPVQLPVVLYKLTLVTLAVPFAYWADRHLFKYHRLEPGEWRDDQGVRMIRRAIIVAAAMIAFAIAL